LRQTEYPQNGLSSSSGRIFSSGFLDRRPRGDRRAPEPQQQLRQIPHTDIPKRLSRRKLEFRRAEGSPFRGIPAQLSVESGGPPVRVQIFSRLALQLFPPMLSLLLMRLQMIKKQLFAPVEAHRRHRGPDGR